MKLRALTRILGQPVLNVSMKEKEKGVKVLVLESVISQKSHFFAEVGKHICDLAMGLKRGRT